MSNTTVDEFLADLGEDGPDDGDEEASSSFPNVPGDDDMVTDEPQLNDEALLEKLKNADITEVATLLSSDHLKGLLQRLDVQVEAGRTDKKVGSVEEDPEYQLIVESNHAVVEIVNEIQLIHMYVRDRYSKKFPELESLVLNPLDYARLVKRIGNETDITLVSLSDILPAAIVMAVSIANSANVGKQLEEAELKKVIEACDMALDLDLAKQKILSFVESRMNFIAPNLSALVGTAVAAKLMATAGGLNALAKMPANNLVFLGATKKNLVGFSTAQSRPHMMGFIYDSDVITKCPPSLRVKGMRVLVGKVALAARTDSNRDASYGWGEAGKKFREEIEKKIEKWQEPPPPKQPKPLAAPDDRPRKKRGGKRAQKMKQKFGVTDMRKNANRMAFGVVEDTFISGETEKGLGMMGMPGSGKVRLTPQDKHLLKKTKQKSYGSSGATSGLSSSLAFTPVQGIELSNPGIQQQQLNRVKQANDRYFSNSGFAQVKKARTEMPPPPNPAPAAPPS